MPIDTMLAVAQGVAKGSTGHNFIYCLEEEKFYTYKDGYWEKISEIELMNIVMGWATGENNTVFLGQYTASKRYQVIDNLRYLIFKKLEMFNKTGFLNFDQGEFDPLTGTLHPHMMSNYSTMRMPYEWDDMSEVGGSNKCDLWIKTLNEIFEADTDPEGAKDKIGILQEFFGYCLTKDTRKEKALLLLGQSRSGKSTILETLGAMLGKHNCAYVTMDFISNPQYTPLLMNKLVNIDTDVNTKADNFESKFKTITSGETLTCNQKFVETFDFVPYCKLAMGANSFPRITDHSMAIYNRLILLPCERVFELHERNIGLKDHLKKELFGVLMWAVEGLHRLNNRGHFEEKDYMKEAIEELREESNPVEVFLKENIEASLENKYSIIYKTELFEKYRQWSLQMNQQYSLSAIKFAQIVYRKYSKYTPKDSKDADGKRVWRNLKYKSNTILPAVDQKDLAWDE